jgi:hypothetical protein
VTKEAKREEAEIGVPGFKGEETVRLNGVINMSKIFL